MAARKTGLNKGYGSLWDSNTDGAQSDLSNSVKLKISEIEPNKAQPRKTFDPEKLNELAASISEHGVLQPLLVRPLASGIYQLVAGERRWRAARMAGLSEVPVIIRELNDQEAAEIALIENLQREDLNPIEEAEGLQMLISTYGLTQDQAASRVNKSRPAVANALRLLNLPEEIRDLARDNKISAGHARALLSFADKAAMLDAAKKIIEQGISVRETERLSKSAVKPASEKKRNPQRDKFFVETEIAVTKALHRNVKINETKSGGGTLEIDFYDKADLLKLIKTLED